MVLPVLSCFSAYSRSTVFTVISPIKPEDSRQFIIQGHGPGNVCNQSVIMTMATSGAAVAAASVISGCNGPAKLDSRTEDATSCRAGGERERESEREQSGRRKH